MPTLLRSLLVIVGKTFCAVLVCFLAVVLTSWLIRGRLATPPVHDPQLVAEVLESRNARLMDRDHPRIHCIWREDIDYKLPTDEPPAWWPREESPILAELVAAGQLPPVEQRLGVELDGRWVSEPIVMEGLDGPGYYGGSWHRLTPNAGDLHIANWRMSGSTLLRWNVQAERLVPHLAKGYDVEEDGRAFTFHLRKGARWSDGTLFTSRDMRFWYEAALASTGNKPGLLRSGPHEGSMEFFPLDEPLELVVRVKQSATYPVGPWLV